MQQIQNEGLAKMQAAEMDVRLSRRPIERYEWPLGAALIALALSILIPERKRTREKASAAAPVGKAVYGVAGGPAGAIATAALLMMFLSSSVFATAPGLDAYQQREIRRRLRPVPTDFKDASGIASRGQAPVRFRRSCLQTKRLQQGDGII